ncbi:tetratricopeptide repeat protein [uncultured Psychroserpens sp.]|uniref:tetratricopeptide repeat protein n=1 Tax=uncultured Psychroserpens sp. TaxID=255436 RepID=UPI00261ED20C|nr:tetratricopeptide repeat protein [uncultured Psychroserpens sp.]
MLFAIVNVSLCAQNNDKFSIKNYHQTFELANDSIKNQLLKECLRQAYINEEWSLFHKCRFDHMTLCERLGDTLAQAKTLEYSGAYFQKQLEMDSAYYYYTKSSFLYDALKDSISLGRVLVNTAILQKNIRDYVGSESTSFRALTYLTNYENKKVISSIYNNLGIVYNNLKDKDNALRYHKDALLMRKSITKKPFLYLQSLNNIGKVYKDYAQYQDASEYFIRILNEDSLLSKSPKFKATVMDNHGHNLFKIGDVALGLDFMKQALKIREEKSDEDGIVINSIHLAEYYVSQSDTSKAIDYLLRAERLSRRIKNYRDYLVSLNFLGNLYNGDKSKAYFAKYKSISDSLDIVDRNNRDQFARIRFDLDRKEKTLAKAKYNLKLRNKIILGFTLIIASTIGFLFYKKIQRDKLKRDFANGLKKYLINKYELTLQNIEFWELWIQGFDQQKMSEKLFISVDAVKSRRKSLREKIDRVKKIDGNFTQAKAIYIYNKEKESFKEVS